MTEQEINQMLDTELTRHRDEDAAHLRSLHGKVAGGRRWYLRWMGAAGLAAVILLAGIPAAYSSLPPSEESLVACNQEGAKADVRQCADLLLRQYK